MTTTVFLSAARLRDPQITFDKLRAWTDSQGCNFNCLAVKGFVRNSTGDQTWGVVGWNYQFHDLEDALLFKLTWGGS